MRNSIMKYEHKKINILMTGGTIDSRWDYISDTAVPLEKSTLPEFFDIVKSSDEILFDQITMKDSRNLNHEDRLKVLEHIESSDVKNFIVTHGTYTMPDTARYLKANLKDNDKKIILTGSMVPMTGFSPSDAGFNLGYAMASFSRLEPGVYVCMNGRIFDPEEIAKDLSEGKFTSIISR